MRHRISYFITAGLVALAACSDSTTEPGGAKDGALVTFAFEGHPADTLKVWITDSASLAAAERYVQAKTGGPRMLTGTIERGFGFDTVHPFRFRPESVRLVDAGIEICDGAPMRSAADVDQFFEWSTGNRASTSATYCPWSSYPVKVERLYID